MPLTIRDGTNTPRTIAEIQIRDGTNTPRDIQQIWARDSNNVSRLIWSLAPPMSASSSPETVTGTTFGTGTATTDATFVSVVGGTPPYTYAWTLVSYSAPTPPMVDAPSSSSTSFTQTGIGSSEVFNANFTCLVTDSTPGTPQTATTNAVLAVWFDIV